MWPTGCTVRYNHVPVPTLIVRRACVAGVLLLSVAVGAYVGVGAVLLLRRVGGVSAWVRGGRRRVAGVGLGARRRLKHACKQKKRSAVALACYRYVIDGQL